MLSIVIPTLNAGSTLPAMLAALGGATPERELLVVDGGSTDDTPELARRLDARVLEAPAGRGTQLAAGARAARGDWLLFLHGDTVLGADWAGAVAAFIAAPANRARAAVFRFALDDEAPAARRLERIVDWRTRALGLPYGDQGLLLSRALYDEVGGFRPLPLMEDLDLVRRIGKRRLTMLEVAARSSAVRYRRDGYVLRPARNLFCLALYLAGVPPRLIRKVYG